MEDNKQFSLEETQTGDDSGYSCTSTQSKYSIKSSHSQSASSGDSCFDEQRSTTLGSTKKGKISPLKSITINQSNQTAIRYVSDLESTINQESNNKNSKSKQINITEFKPKINKILNTDELKQPQRTSKIEFDEPKHLIEDTKRNHDQNNATFIHLADLCQSYHKHKNTKTQTTNFNDEFSIEGTVIKEINDQEILIKEIVESNEIHDDLFGVIISMNDGLIINTSKSIQKNMGYPRDMWQGRSFIDFIHPKDRLTFISYVTSVLKDPYTISKLGPEEKLENPINFITKHNALFEWCYVDHLTVSHFGYLPQNLIGKSIFEYYNEEDVTIIKEVHEKLTKNKSFSYTGKPYRFKCQNGDFALVETEWSYFVNPWAGRVEFFTGKHKVIQGPVNPDVTNPIDTLKSEEINDVKKNTNEIYED